MDYVNAQVTDQSECRAALTNVQAVCAQATAVKIRFDIAPQAASSALIEFGRQADITILVGADARDVQVPGLKGTYRVEEGLELLLKGTRLHFRITYQSIFVDREAAELEKSGPSTTTTPARGTHKPAVNNKRGVLAAFVAAVLGTAAADGRADQEAESRPTPQLTEIVVTAQKREERMLDVPQSLTVLSSDSLSKLDALQFRDYANTIPGLSFATAGAGLTQTSLRGVTVGNDVSSTVGIYVDEVPYGSSTAFALNAYFAFDSALIDLDRIEVLRGPQGTLYGASAMGGLIKYVSNRPDTTTFGGNLQLGISTTHDGGDNENVAATINAPLARDRAALRVTGFYSRDDGYIDNLAHTDDDVDNSDIYGGRLDLLFTPTDALSFRITGYMQDIDRDGDGTADYAFDGAKPNGDLGQFRIFSEPFDQRFRLISGTVAYEMDWATFIAISAYQTVQNSFLNDISAIYAPLLNSFGFGPYSAVGYYQKATGSNKFTQELRLASSGSDRSFQWTIGGYYNNENSENQQEFVLLDEAGNPAPNILYEVSRPADYDEYAIFGDVTWHLTDKFDVTGGIRYAENDQTFTQFGSGLLVGSVETKDSNEDVTTYLANARYHFTDSMTGYLRYATGYRPGGPNVVTIATESPTFEADELASYEAGFKAESSDRRFGLDLAGYYIDWDNIQLLVIRSGLGAYTNAPGGATIVGAELTVSAQMGDALSITAAFAYQDATMSEADADLGAADGERLPNVPKFTGALSADYEFAAGEVQPTLGATIRYIGDREASFDASTSYPQYHLPDYTLVDLRTGLTFGRIDTQFYIHNVFDERAQQSILLPQFGPRVAILQPRTIGVSFTTRF